MLHVLLRNPATYPPLSPSRLYVRQDARSVFWMRRPFYDCKETLQRERKKQRSANRWGEPKLNQGSAPSTKRALQQSHRIRPNSAGKRLWVAVWVHSWISGIRKSGRDCWLKQILTQTLNKSPALNAYMLDLWPDHTAPFKTTDSSCDWCRFCSAWLLWPPPVLLLPPTFADPLHPLHPSR